MTRQGWKKHHKITGIAAALFLLLFCISGLILNHRSMYSKVDLSRKYLPSNYHYKNWNMGLLRGRCEHDNQLLGYGDAGIFIISEDSVAELNQGLPPYSDFRHIRNVFVAHSKDNLAKALYAIGQYGIYSFEDAAWHEIPLPLRRDERLSDGAILGDSLIVLSRNRILISTDNKNFESVEIKPGNDFDGKFSLFRYIWLLHSGQMWGMPGKVIVDLVGLTFVFLTFSGLVFWLWPLRIKKLRERGFSSKRWAKTLAWNAKWHIKIGIWAFVVLCFVVITGWCLRPPLLIPFVLTQAPGIEGSALSPSKPWIDKLRAIRWDNMYSRWLLSTSDGFYSLEPSLRSIPQKIEYAPRVSVMGVTVLEQEPDGQWLVGSLSGLYRWNIDTQEITDYFTGEPADNKPGAPFGKQPVAGYMAEYRNGKLANEIIFDYYKGAIHPDERSFTGHTNSQLGPIDSNAKSNLLIQPAYLSTAPISLWNLALEVHTGRIYNLFGLAPLIWIFLAGALIFWLLISGYKSARFHSPFWRDFIPLFGAISFPHLAQL